MARYPAFLFNVSEVQTSLGVCSDGAKVLWLDLIGVMWQSARQGYLVLPNGRPMESDQVARLCRKSIKAAERYLGELLAAGVFEVEAETLAIYSRPLVEQAEKSERLAAAGRKGADQTNQGRVVAEREADGHPDGQAEQWPTATPTATPSARPTASDRPNKGRGRKENQKENPREGSGEAVAAQAGEGPPTLPEIHSAAVVVEPAKAESQADGQRDPARPPEDVPAEVWAEACRLADAIEGVKLPDVKVQGAGGQARAWAVLETLSLAGTKPDFPIKPEDAARVIEDISRAGGWELSDNLRYILRDFQKWPDAVFPALDGKSRVMAAWREMERIRNQTFRQTKAKQNGFSRPQVALPA